MPRGDSQVKADTLGEGDLLPEGGRAGRALPAPSQRKPLPNVHARWRCGGDHSDSRHGQPRGHGLASYKEKLNRALGRAPRVEVVTQPESGLRIHSCLGSYGQEVTQIKKEFKASRVDQAKFRMVNITDSSGFCIKIPKLKERVHFAKQKHDEPTQSVFKRNNSFWVVTFFFF